MKGIHTNRKIRRSYRKRENENERELALHNKSKDNIFIAKKLWAHRYLIQKDQIQRINENYQEKVKRPFTGNPPKPK